MVKLTSRKQTLFPLLFVCFYQFNHRFLFIQFHPPSLHFHSSALLLHSISPLHFITPLFLSLNAASNGFTSHVMSLPVSLGVTQTFAQGFMLHCTHSKHPQKNTHKIQHGLAHCSEQTDGALNLIYVLQSRSNTLMDTAPIKQIQCTLRKYWCVVFFLLWQYGFT